MGLLSKVVGAITGSSGAAKAAGRAADIQSQSADKAIAFQRESRDLARSDLQPFREAGQAQLDPLSSLISDPQAQLNFIQNNPFFNSLANDAQSRLFANQAARGKVGSGGTAQALQNSLLLLGQDLLNNNVNQRFNMATMGQNAAAGQGTMTMQAGNTISDLMTQQGNALAAGQIGAANAHTQGLQSLIGAGSNLGAAAIMASDVRLKEHITRIGHLDSGIPVYRFRYKGQPQVHVGVLAQEVEHTIPDAVLERDGIKFVNYERLH